MESLRRSFESHGSDRRSSLESSGFEDRPILFDHQFSDSTCEVVVNVDGNGSNGGGAIGFLQYDRKQQNPPSSQQQHQSPMAKMKATTSGAYMDTESEMVKLRKPRTSPSGSNELRVSFENPSSETLSRRAQESDSSSSSSDESHTDHRAQRSQGIPPRPNAARGEVLRCTSRDYTRGSTLPRTKTKSRLMDPPPTRPRSSNNTGMGDGNVQKATTTPRSGLLKSGLLGKHDQSDEDEDDPFAYEDIPDDFHRGKFSTVTVLQWLSLVLILGALACTLLIPVLQHQTLWNLHLWKWEVLVLVLICGHLVSGWCIRIIVFLVERNFLLRKRVLYFVYGVRKAVQNCMWLGLVLLAWNYLFDKKVERETESKILLYVTKVLVCFLVATLFWLVKTLLLKVLASSFHVSTYFDRIQESLFNQYIIETLSGPPLVELQKAREEEENVLAEIDKIQNAGVMLPPGLKEAILPNKRSSPIGGKSTRFSGSFTKNELTKQKKEEGITIEHLHKLNQKNISAWNMKRLMNIVRHGALTTLDEQLTDASTEDESTTKIQSEYEAKKAARKIFINVAKPGAKYVYLVDLIHFMREDEAIKTMSLFDGTQKTDRVSRSSLKNWVVNAFRERRALSLTLNDTKTAVRKLHHMVNVVVGIIVFVIWLLILGIATSHLLVLMSSQLLLAVFIFGNTCKMTFEAIVFLFVMHPFDVGDRCEIDKVQMIVEEMNILTTVLLRFDGLKITYPNTVLLAKPISNFYRSPDMGDSIDFCIHVSTPVEKVAIMKERIKGYIESKKEYWHERPSVVLRDVEDMNRLKVSVWFQHRMNHQDMGERFLRREHVVQEMIKCFKDLDIEYRMLPLDVNLRNLPPLVSSRLPSTWTTCG